LLTFTGEVRLLIPSSTASNARRRSTGWDDSAWPGAGWPARFRANFAGDVAGSMRAYDAAVAGVRARRRRAQWLHATREPRLCAERAPAISANAETSLRRALTEAVGFGLHSIAACAQSNLERC